MYTDMIRAGTVLSSNMDTGGVRLHVWFLSLLLVAEFSVGIGVMLDIQHDYVTMDNGMVQVTLSNPQGMVTGIKYNGMDNLLATTLGEPNRGYWDLVWNDPDGVKGKLEVIHCKEFKVILQNDDQVEVSFTRPWDHFLKGALVPLNIDKRFIMLKDSTGFYTYSIVEHLKGWPSFSLVEVRVAFKLGLQFDYMAVDNDRQGKMPSADDRSRGKVLAFKEAVELINPIDNEKVDDKYQWSVRNDENKVHGWVGSNRDGSLVGFWQITPSFEFRLGGPFKQELTSHVGPTSLTNFLTAHYMGNDLIPTFTNGEYWKKVLGPVFIYLNSGPSGTNERTLWEDAYDKMNEQTSIWPYSFPVSEDFPKSNQRGFAHGRLLVQDWYVNKKLIPAASAYVGLALPGEIGSWQTEGKGYQFWTRACPDGTFSINNVRAGKYNLYATVPGFIGDYMSNTSIIIMPGQNIELGDLQYNPPRRGPTFWEIGYPDRTAAEFFIPDPNRNYFNPRLANQRFRQYGLWEQYSVFYPDNDLDFTVDKSDYRKDWFFAQVTRKINERHAPTTWRIRFNLDNVQQNGLYTLRVALASTTYAKLQLRFNDLQAQPPHFTTGTSIGRDNAIARHGIHGKYTLLNINVQSAWLVKGENVIFLTQDTSYEAFDEAMYDYIRFEGPSNNIADIAKQGTMITSGYVRKTHHPNVLLCGVIFIVYRFYAM